jgi:hypothetical protein
MVRQQQQQRQSTSVVDQFIAENGGMEEVSRQAQAYSPPVQEENFLTEVFGGFCFVFFGLLAFIL